MLCGSKSYSDTRILAAKGLSLAGAGLIHLVSDLLRINPRTPDEVVHHPLNFFNLRSKLSKLYKNQALAVGSGFAQTQLPQSIVMSDPVFLSFWAVRWHAMASRLASYRFSYNIS